MFKKILDEHLAELVKIRERLASTPAATAEPDAGYWDALQDEAAAVLAIIRAKNAEYQAHVDAKNEKIRRLSEKITS